MVLDALLDRLAAARSDGLDFDTAWPGALGAALRAAERHERPEWAAAIEATQEAWRSSFERRGPGQEALAGLREARELADPPSRECAHCGAPVASRDPRAMYCSPRCRRDAYVARAA